MTPCARGCCWVPMEGVCARQRGCPCHDHDTPRNEPRGDTRGHRAPTEDQAIRNVMSKQRRRK